MPILPYSSKGATSAAGGQSPYDAVVAASGGDYTTVTAAITAGKTNIFVKPGSYTETAVTSGSPNTTANITITGTNSNATTLVFGTNDFYMNGTNLTIQGVSLSVSTGRMNFNGDHCYLRDVRLLASAASTISMNVSGLYAILDGFKFIDSSTVAASVGTRIFVTGNNSHIGNSLFIVAKNGTSGCLEIDGQSTAVVNCSFKLTTGANGAALLNMWGIGQSCSGCNFNNPGNLDSDINIGNFGVTVSGCTFDGGALAVNITSTYYATITGNSFYMASIGTTAINVGGNLNLISGNNIRCRSTVSTTVLGIVVAASKNNNTITGNTVTNAFVGLTINTGATNTVVVGNTLTANGTNLSDSGTTTVNTGNVTT